MQRFGEKFPGRGGSSGRGIKVETSFLCLRNGKKAGVAGAGGGGGWEGGRGRPRSTCWAGLRGEDTPRA